MSDSQDQGPSKSIRLRRVLANPGAIKTAHRFLYTRVGRELVLDVGFYDLPDLHAVMSSPSPSEGDDLPTVDFFVADRFTLSPDGVANLYAVAKKMVADLQKNGVLPDPLPEGDV